MMMYLFNKYIVFRGGQKPCNVCKIDISSTIFNQCQWKKAEKIGTKKNISIIQTDLIRGRSMLRCWLCLDGAY